MAHAAHTSKSLFFVEVKGSGSENWSLRGGQLLAKSTINRAIYCIFNSLGAIMTFSRVLILKELAISPEVLDQLISVMKSVS
jgi:hypothetical protein